MQACDMCNNILASLSRGLGTQDFAFSDWAAYQAAKRAFFRLDSR